MRARSAGLLLALTLLGGGAVGEEKRAQQKRAGPRVLRVALGEPFEFGGVRYRVKSITRVSALWPSQDRPERPPPGTWFVCAWYVLENTGQNPIRVQPRFYMRDAKGRRFTVSADVQWLLRISGTAGHEEVETFDDDLQPGVPKELVSGFVMPDDAFGDHLRLYFLASGKFDFIEIPVTRWITN
jgi:hypothetical protein